ncbi:MAG: hypothetical protein C0592_06380 [Marinilabiliales bacterium]|nr:MAG: hypothetical protein C0592_06380 [Marinilabiliales bacterium]
MRKVFLFLFVLISVSCSKDIDSPSEFNYVLGKWKAYKYRHISDFGQPFSSYVDYSTDSIGIEYYCDISEKKINIINSQTNSTTLIIKGVEILVQDSVLITFDVLTYSYPKTEHGSHYITYRFTDEINFSSAHERSGSNPNSEVDVYYLKRIGD